MNYKPLTLIIVAMFVTQTSFAEEQQVTGSDVQTSADKTSAAVSSEANKANKSMKENSDKSNSMNNMAMATQALTGGLMGVQSVRDFAKCSSQSYGHCITGAIYAGLSVLSFAQALQHKKAASSAAGTAYGTDGLGQDPFSMGAGSLDPNSSKIVSAHLDGKALKDLGYYNQKTGKITTPDGKSYNSSDFSSKGAMLAAGFSPDVVDKAIKNYQKTASEAEKKVSALAGSGGFEGGGGGSSSVTYVDEEVDPAAMGRGAAPVQPNERDPANLAGMQKNYNGEPIGVAADSIFLMMNRRYKVKDTQDAFFTEIEMPVVQRSK